MNILAEQSLLLIFLLLEKEIEKEMLQNKTKVYVINKPYISIARKMVVNHSPQIRWLENYVRLHNYVHGVREK